MERDALKEKEVNGKKSKLIDITLEDHEGKRIHCSLWDQYAIRMDAHLTVHDPNSCRGDFTFGKTQKILWCYGCLECLLWHQADLR